MNLNDFKQVYSESQKRWVHVDPSENVVDSPLMYQHGWKRDIDYVFAFSKDNLQDVTWRYVSDHKETLTRRKRCSEKELVKAILTLRKKRQSNLPLEKWKMLCHRDMSELIQLTVERLHSLVMKLRNVN